MNVFGVSVNGVTQFAFVAKDVEKALEHYGNFVTQNGLSSDEAKLFQFRKSTVKAVTDLAQFYAIDSAKEIEIKASVEVQGTVFKEDPKMIEGRESWKREHGISDGGREDEPDEA